MPQRPAVRAFLAALALAALPWSAPPAAEPRAPRGAEEPVFVQRGEASHYSDEFRGRKTASGERFRQDGATAASRELPFGTRVTVTHEETGRSVEVRINDRGPHVQGRVIDLSRSAAQAIGIVDDGVAMVRIEARPSAQPTEALKRAILRKARLQAARRPPPPEEKPPAPGPQG